MGNSCIMKREELSFERPTDLFASQPPEMRGQSRDEVRLMVTWPEGNNSHHAFTDLPTLLKQGDLLVVNESATLPASLPATSQLANIRLNLSTRFSDNLWIAVPRWSVSSLEIEDEIVEHQALYPETFHVPAATANAVNATRARGGRVVAVGTTVVRALETAWNGSMVRGCAGSTSLYVHPGTGVHVVDGLLTGLHDPVTSHLAMLSTLMSIDHVRKAYAAAA